MTLTQGYRFAYGLAKVDLDVMLLTREDKMSLANMVLGEGYNSAWVSWTLTEIIFLENAGRYCPRDDNAQHWYVTQAS